MTHRVIANARGPRSVAPGRRRFATLAPLSVATLHGALATVATPAAAGVARTVPERHDGVMIDFDAVDSPPLFVTGSAPKSPDEGAARESRGMDHALDRFVALHDPMEHLADAGTK